MKKISLILTLAVLTSSVSYGWISPIFIPKKTRFGAFIYNTFHRGKPAIHVQKEKEENTANKGLY